MLKDKSFTEDKYHNMCSIIFYRSRSYCIIMIVCLVSISICCCENKIQMFSEKVIMKIIQDIKNLLVY